MNNPYKGTTYKGKPIDEHRKVMEQRLGRKLESWEIVHHINGNKRDNKIENKNNIPDIQKLKNQKGTLLWDGENITLVENHFFLKKTIFKTEE